ncbi:MAG: hypothetical protein LBU89_09270 [Fibromonadaceae bacterium]|nr:hypothetical protein [Fibromonadaceae bacterium]
MKKRSHTEWEELIRDYEESGQPQKAWCEKNDINLYTLRDRMSRIRKTEGKLINKPAIFGKGANNPNPTIGEAPTTVEWLPVISGTQPSTENDSLEIKIGPFTIVTSENFNETAFSQACKLLMRLC